MLCSAYPLILAGGLAYSNDLRGWLAHRPSDSAGQLAASFHTYDFTVCKDAACWDSQILPVSQAVPVVTTEIGEDVGVELAVVQRPVVFHVVTRARGRIEV